jgi:dipeptidyl aminopeptidase/acylaminoacyl peptidase
MDENNAMTSFRHRGRAPSKSRINSGCCPVNLAHLFSWTAVAVSLVLAQFEGRATTAIPTGDRPSGEGRIIVAIQFSRGSSLEDDYDPYWGTAICSVDPGSGQPETLVDKATNPRAAANGESISFATKDSVFAQRDGMTRAFQDIQEATLAVFSPGGSEIIYSVHRTGTGRTFDTWRCPVESGQPTRTAIPISDSVIDWSPDGNWLLTLRGAQLCKMHPDGTGQQTLGNRSGVYSFSRFSPDGKRIVYFHQSTDHNTAKNSLWIMDSDGHNSLNVLPYRADSHPFACWSPDGKRLAVVDCDPTRPIEDQRYRLEVMDADGRNQRVLPLGRVLWLSPPDWNTKISREAAH